MIQFKVWHIPQVPMKAFEVVVYSREEGLRISEILALYDLFQYNNKIKPDYCNTGGVVFHAAPISEDDDDWLDVPEDDDEWNDYLAEITAFEEAQAAKDKAG